MIGWSKLSTNQNHYPDRASDTSSVWNFSTARSSDVISLRNCLWRSREMSAVFLGYRSGRSHAMLPAPHGWGQGALRRDFSPSGCKGDHPHTKWLVFISLFLFFFYILFLVLVFFMRLNGTVKYFRWDALSWYFVLQVTAAYIIQAVTIDKKKKPINPFGY